jgi:non-canonical (house-cleaning) NTP pyrophosphatase
MTTGSLSDFLGRYQRGIEVGVAGASADELLGVREAFRRFFQDGLGRPVAVAVVPQEHERPLRGLAGSDGEAIAAARLGAERIAERLGPHYQFYVGLDVGVQAIDLPEGTRYLLRSWSAVFGPPGLAFGASGSLELPARWLDERGAEREGVPGTRRGGGLISTLTGGLESRRAAVAQATLHALATLFYGILAGRAGGAR